MRRSIYIFCTILAMAAGQGFGQVTITGVADRTVYSTGPTILIANNAGYTSAAL
jgi:hypothetical protein